MRVLVNESVTTHFISINSLQNEPSDKTIPHKIGAFLFKFNSSGCTQVTLFAKQNLKDDSNSPTFQLMKNHFAWKDRRVKGKEC